MYVKTSKRLGRLRGRGHGLGIVSTMVNGSLVYGETPVRGTARWPVPYRAPAPTPIIPINSVRPQPVVNPAWPTAGQPQNQMAVAQSLLQTNPGALTQAQWNLLQQAGLVASTVPYSSAGQVNSGGAIDPATGQTYASELAAAQAAATATAATSTAPSIGTTLSTTYAGLPLYLWLVGGVGAYFLLSGKRGR
jgi:hypothetical protein